MTVTVREVVAADLPAITALYADEVLNRTATFEQTPPDEAEMERRIAAVQALGATWFVAEVDGALAGYAYLGAFRTRSAYRYTVENSVYVDPAFQRRGVGRVLMKAVLDDARRLGLRNIMAVISQSETSDASVALHRALGFEDAGVWRNAGWKFDQWLDVIVMQLVLEPTDAPPSSEGLALNG